VTPDNPFMVIVLSIITWAALLAPVFAWDRYRRRHPAPHPTRPAAVAAPVTVLAGELAEGPSPYETPVIGDDDGGEDYQWDS
jgi:hypothetical protein